MTPFVMPNRDEEQAFWKFVAARQHTWWQNVVWNAGEPEQTHNIYRVLDIQTQYSLQLMEMNISSMAGGPRQGTAVCHAILYRLFNNPDIYEQIAYTFYQMLQLPISADTVHTESALAVLEVALRTLDVQNVQLTHGVQLAQQEDFIVNALRLAEWLVMGRHVFSSHVASSCDITQLFNLMGMLSFIHESAIAEVVLDFATPLAALRGTPYAGYVTQDVLVLSPTIRKALSRLGVRGSEKPMHRAIRHIHERQHIAMVELGLDFKPVRDTLGNPVELSRADIGWALDAWVFPRRPHTFKWRPDHFISPAFGTREDHM